MTYDILTEDRLRQVADDDHKEGTVGEARNMARELLEVRHALKSLARAELEAVVAAARALRDANSDDADLVIPVMDAVSAFDAAVGYVRR